MKKIIAIMLVLGLMFTFTACKEKGGQGENDDQSKGTVVSIEGNVSTGYSWQATRYDSSIIKVEEIGTESLGEKDVVGAPALHKFKIIGLKEGTTELGFDYYRVFEGAESTVDVKEYIVTVDSLLNVVATEKIDVDDEPSEDDFLASSAMEELVNDLISKSNVMFPMAASSKIVVANAPTFVGLSEELYKSYVVDSVVYEPMISPATSSMCIVEFSESADVASLKQTILDNCNPAKWVCTGAEKCLVIDSGRYVMLVMSTSENCEALKKAFTEHFGTDKVGTALTKDGVSTDVEELPPELF